MSIASKYKGLSKYARTNIKTYGLVISLYLQYCFPLQNAGMISNSISGQLIPICAYIVMAISLNLTVGVLGELVSRSRRLYERGRVHGSHSHGGSAG